MMYTMKTVTETNINLRTYTDFFLTSINHKYSGNLYFLENGWKYNKNR